MKNICYLLFTLSAIFVSCQSNESSPAVTKLDQKTDVVLSLAEEIETAHKKTNFLTHRAIQYDINIIYGGKEILNAVLTLKPNSSKGKIELRNGRTIIYSEGDIYYTPEFENAKGPRFTAYTWSYFFLFPYKLSDPGTNWTDYPNKSLNSKQYAVQKLAFEAGTGDAPDDWYIVYADKQSKLVQVAAYIVTAGRSKEKAEEDPHAIQYLNYKEVEGIPIAQNWKFWAWRASEGLTDQLGEAALRNIRFVWPDKDFFDPHENMLKG